MEKINIEEKIFTSSKRLEKFIGKYIYQEIYRL